MTDTFDPAIIPRIAERLDPERKRLSWWEPRAATISNPWRYTGPTDPALAWLAFEPLVRERLTVQEKCQLTNQLLEFYQPDAGRKFLPISFDQWVLFEMTPEQYLTALAAALEGE